MATNKNCVFLRVPKKFFFLITAENVERAVLKNVSFLTRDFFFEENPVPGIVKKLCFLRRQKSLIRSKVMKLLARQNL